jgi:serine O-acetyltransferase
MDFLRKREETRRLLDEILNGLVDLPGVLGAQRSIEQDAEFLFKNDPSARSVDEVKTYSSFFAVAAYRIAHIFPDQLQARAIAEYAKSITGVDIHPKAEIGVPFAIDHGVGTVIGETARIGAHCLLYHGVTLGAKHLKEREQEGVDRHPKLGDGIVVYSNTTILGNVQVPDGLIVGANQFIKSQEEVDELVARQKAKRAAN